MDLDLITWLLCGLIVAVLFFLGYRMLRKRMDRMRYEEQLAELEFQESLLAGLDTGGLGGDARFLQAETVDAVKNTATHELVSCNTACFDTLVTPAADPAVNLNAKENQTEGPPAADMAASAVMKQLNATGLVSSVEGYIPLHGNAKGVAMLRLRNGKQALLVPHMESEAFLRHNARRADIIIMAGTDGRAVVVTPLEQFLAESITSG